MNKIIQNIFRVSLSLITLIILIGLIISVYPFKEYTFRQQPYPVLVKQVKAGETLQVKADYCKLSNAKGEIDIIFEGASQYVYHISFQAPKGCNNTILSIPIPKDLFVGLYHYHAHGEYTHFLIGKAKVDTYTEEFEIIK